MLAQTLAHPAIQRLQQKLASVLPVDAVPGPNTRLAAVAAIIRVVAEPELLFIKRADAEGDPWSGHIAFPGGRFEQGDESLERTALRETLEELSLNIETSGRIIGRLDDLAPNARTLPPIIIRPFVALVEPATHFALSREVADAFWVPVSELGSDRSKSEHVMTINGTVARFPAYWVNAHTIWGLTERIVRQLLPLFD